MKVGRYTYGTENIRLMGDMSNLIIGSFCSIASGVTVYVGAGHRTDRLTTYPFGHIHKDIFSNFDGEGHPTTSGDVIIGNDVWIGSGATIMSGVTIGSGAVIGANAHVTCHVDPYEVVGGNPASLLYYRFSEDDIRCLTLMRWWNWEDRLINEALPLICSNNIDALWDFYNTRVGYGRKDS